jgi:ADP-ribose pyrophosphatase YjhB (NUDIX family)
VAKYLYGERIGKTAQIRVGASAIIFDESGQKILLTRRTDNGRWCLPGGQMDAGESIEETCVREVFEETGLHVEVTRLIGVYTTPHRITTYDDGNRWQLVSFSFVARVTGGTPGLSNETTEYGYFSPEEMAGLDLMEAHQERIADLLSDQQATLIKSRR